MEKRECDSKIGLMSVLGSLDVSSWHRLAVDGFWLGPD